ncbi:MAG: hypothetical protein ACJ76T_08780 [Solirubrobacteraceae bacterium]
MPRSLIVLALAVVLLALAAVPAGSAPKTLFPANCDKPTYKPTRIVVACGDGNNRLARIKWESYGTDAASGTATAVVNDCEPNCAAGTFHHFRAVVTLNKPKDCGRYRQFTRLVERFTDETPESFGSKVVERFPCAS